MNHPVKVASSRIAECRASFLRHIETDPVPVIYGVTTAMGELASRQLELGERGRHARIKAFAAATSFGEPLPDRVVRAIVLARLANFLEGHAATTPRMALAVAAMLDGGPMSMVPSSGQGGAGEIFALYPLFAELSTRFDLEVKERGSLINGSPCAAALVADAALAARRRVHLAEKVFALSIEAFRAPLEHYDPALDALWGDEHEAVALRGLRELLAGAGTGRPQHTIVTDGRHDASDICEEGLKRRNYQAPVSYRIVPRILGHAHRALSCAKRAATVSLASVSDNPVYIPPDDGHPLGRCISTGGYHNAMATPALDDLAAIWADVCLLCDRHASKLLNGKVSLLPDLLLMGRDWSDSDGHGNDGYVPMAITGYLEQAKLAAQRTFIPGTESAGAGQDDVATTVFLAWTKEARSGRCLDAAMAMLAVVASQALHVTERAAPPALQGLATDLHRVFFPGDAENGAEIYVFSRRQDNCHV
ncbi:aromatic amino acid lyase [Mesorhizobium sp. M1312]|uniref:aromatic amino acid lyase n=1 Tax=unclassified Mesorhizobium TaxID=325217 RepID=UPI00333932BB